MTIETKLTGYCPACSEQSSFEYKGTQRFDRVELELYNCGECRTTIHLESIKQYTKVMQHLDELALKMVKERLGL